MKKFKKMIKEHIRRKNALFSKTGSDDGKVIGCKRNGFDSARKKKCKNFT